MSQKCWKNSNHEHAVYGCRVLFDQRLIFVFTVLFIILHLSIWLTLWRGGASAHAAFTWFGVIAEMWVTAMSLKFCLYAMYWDKHPISISYEKEGWLLGDNRTMVGLERNSMVTPYFCLLIFSWKGEGRFSFGLQRKYLIITPPSVGDNTYAQLLTLCRWNRRVWRH